MDFILSQPLAWLTLLVTVVYLAEGQMIHSVDRVHAAIEQFNGLPEAIQKYVDEERKKLDELEQ